jgi:nucleoid-associated protein YgaU
LVTGGAANQVPSDPERNSASAFLDKYYADDDSTEPPGGTKAVSRATKEKRGAAAKGIADPAAQRQAVVPRAAPGRAVRRAPPKSPSAAKSARPAPARRPRSVAQPTASTPIVADLPETIGDVRLPFRGAPFLLAVLAALAVALLVVLPFTSGVTRAETASHPAPAPAGASTAQPAAPVARTYVVQPGDSLWKIFHSLGPGGRGGASWRDFLSSTRSVNGLGDPDLIHPGAVLSITPQGR